MYSLQKPWTVCESTIEVTPDRLIYCTYCNAGARSVLATEHTLAAPATHS